MRKCGRISLQLIPGRMEASIMQTFHCPQVTIVKKHEIKYKLCTNNNIHSLSWLTTCFWPRHIRLTCFDYLERISAFNRRI